MAICRKLLNFYLIVVWLKFNKVETPDIIIKVCKPIISNKNNWRSLVLLGSFYLRQGIFLKSRIMQDLITNRNMIRKLSKLFFTKLEEIRNEPNQGNPFFVVSINSLPDILSRFRNSFKLGTLY